MKMPKFKVGDIIVAKNKTPVRIEMPDHTEVTVYPWVYGRVIFVHPEHGHFTYNNGAFNQGDWIEDAYTLQEWNRSAHSPLVPIINRNII